MAMLRYSHAGLISHHHGALDLPGQRRCKSDRNGLPTLSRPSLFGD